MRLRQFRCDHHRFFPLLFCEVQVDPHGAHHRQPLLVRCDPLQFRRRFREQREPEIAAGILDAELGCSRATHRAPPAPRIAAKWFSAASRIALPAAGEFV